MALDKKLTSPHFSLDPRFHVPDSKLHLVWNLKSRIDSYRMTIHFSATKSRSSKALLKAHWAAFIVHLAM
jgi:hypothetical protein